MPIFAPSTILDKYRIVSQIGQGGMGRVWQAEEITFVNRAVAIKEARADLPETDLADMRRRYQQEVQVYAALQKIGAPNLVTVHTVDQFEDSEILVMEFMAGGDLDRLLRQHPNGLPVKKSLGITSAILEALQTAHEHAMEIVHRDVKPSNILFDAVGKPYLTDFGLAQLAGSSGRSQLQVGRAHPGTPAYMAPEQASSSGYLTPAADIYAVGCVLFEMLTGKRYKRVRPGTAVSSLRSDIPPWLDTFVSRAVAMDRFDRYEDAGRMLIALVNAGTAAVGRQSYVQPPVPVPDQAHQSQPNAEETMPEMQQAAAWDASKRQEQSKRAMQADAAGVSSAAMHTLHPTDPPGAGGNTVALSPSSIQPHSDSAGISQTMQTSSPTHLEGSDSQTVATNPPSPQPSSDSARTRDVRQKKRSKTATWLGLAAVVMVIAGLLWYSGRPRTSYIPPVSANVTLDQGAQEPIMEPTPATEPTATSKSILALTARSTATPLAIEVEMPNSDVETSAVYNPPSSFKFTLHNKRNIGVCVAFAFPWPSQDISLAPWMAHGWYCTDSLSSLDIVEWPVDDFMYFHIKENTMDGDLIVPADYSDESQFCISNDSFASLANTNGFAIMGVSGRFPDLDVDTENAILGLTCEQAGGYWATFYKLRVNTDFTVNP